MFKLFLGLLFAASGAQAQSLRSEHPPAVPGVYGQSIFPSSVTATGTGFSIQATNGGIYAKYGVVGATATFFGGSSTSFGFGRAPTQFHDTYCSVGNVFCGLVESNGATSQSYGLKVIGGTDASDIAFLVNKKGEGANYFTVRGDGRTSIASVTPGETALAVSGTIQQGTVLSCSLGLTTTSTGAISGCVTSSRQYKKDIKPLQYSPGLIDSLRPVSFRYKDAERGSGLRAGFIAEELHSAFPQGTAPSGPKTLGVDSNAVIAVLVKEVQMLRKRVAALEK